MRSCVVVVILAAVTKVTFQQQDAQCVDHLRTLERPWFQVALEDPVNYGDAVALCRLRDAKLSNWSEVMGYEVNCSGQLVPVNDDDNFGCSPCESCGEDPLYGQDFGAPAFDVMSNECGYVDSNSLFSCILCQYNLVIFPQDSERASGYGDLTTSEFFVVRLTSSKVTDTSELDEDMLRIYLEVLLNPWEHAFTGKFNFHRSLDETGHLQVDFKVNTLLLTSVAKVNGTVDILNDTFTVTSEDVDFCPSEETLDSDGAVVHWPRARTYNSEFSKPSKNGTILRRDCHFDEDLFQGYWDSEMTTWQLVFAPCTPDPDMSLTDALYINEEHYKQFLDVADINTRHANMLHNFTSTPVNNTTLNEVTRLVGREMALMNELHEQIIRDLVTVTANLEIDEQVVVMEELVYLIVADIDFNVPVVGFACNCDLQSYTGNDSITVEKAPAPKERNASAPFALDVTAILMSANIRVTFLVLWKHMPIDLLFGRYSYYFEVNIMFPLAQVSAWTFMSYGNYYVDISYFQEQYFGEFLEEETTVLICVAWNNALHDWVSLGCEMVEANRTGFSTCRCSGKYFVLHEGVPIGKFALKKDRAIMKAVSDTNSFYEFFKGKIILKIATFIECLLSSFGLGSIICTAIGFKRWRENKGHKILLHMVLALTCNLVLGFVASFARLKTASVGCLVYGVLRHYSFLAMFLWMLVLSCLQLKRLTTVVGAKATSHLILKASLFAWGMPLLPITILLGVNHRLYQMDRFDRGYCYPEGIVFHLTVQGPAGVILFVNLGIFIKILLHIFEFIGEKKITKHSKGKRAEQLNKLKTSLFIFFLFGFSWVFHILSEERVIVSDFLYEFLFLITATTHIFALSLFFVVFQENTRKEWIIVLKRSAGKIRQNFNSCKTDK